MSLLSVLRPVALAAVFLITPFAFAADPIDVDANGVAIKGYDPVSYFTVGEATMGKTDFSTQYQGASYRFASAENRELFLANPEKYAPAFGGFCAFGTTFSKKIPTDPQAWKIVDGRLYLNSGAKAHELWQNDTSGNISKANDLWMAIKDKSIAELN